ncbi:MAG: AAA family ATPase [Clostridia bacterium]|nr:AAA family ATPase [Clostridia bacterium]
MLRQINSDWTEKYRPQTLEDIILSVEARTLIEKYIKEDIIDNLFLCSRPGQGKTSLAKLLAYNIFECDTLYVNASDENNVEVVRTKITGFARTRSSNGKFKIVILDEADGFANVQAQRILRALMEEVSENTRFIITANNKNRIHDAIRSRCKMVDITPPMEGVIRRVLHILAHENITMDKQVELPKLRALIERFYPDIRSIIKNLQSCVFDGVLKLKDYNTDSMFIKNVLNYVLDKDYIELRRYIINNESKFNNDYASMVADFYHLIVDSDQVDDAIKPNWVIIIADYLYKFEEIIDPEINAFACFYKLMKSF